MDRVKFHVLMFASSLHYVDYKDVLCLTEGEKGFILILEILYILDLEFGFSHSIMYRGRSKIEYEYGTGSRHPSHLVWASS